MYKCINCGANHPANAENCAVAQEILNGRVNTNRNNVSTVKRLSGMATSFIINSRTGSGTVEV